MLGLWHEGEWLKRDLAKRFYGQLESGSSILDLDFVSLMKGYFSLYFYEHFDYIWSIWLYFHEYFCCYYVGYVRVL